MMLKSYVKKFHDFVRIGLNLLIFSKMFVCLALKLCATWSECIRKKIDRISLNKAKG